MGAAPSLYAKPVQKGGTTRLRRAVMHHLVMHRILLHPGHPERGRELRRGEWCRNDRTCTKAARVQVAGLWVGAMNDAKSATLNGASRRRPPTGRTLLRDVSNRCAYLAVGLSRPD